MGAAIDLKFPFGNQSLLWLVPLLGWLAGCADQRISYDEMLRRDHLPAAPANAAIEPAQVALSENRPYELQVGDVVTLILVGTNLEDRFASTSIDVRLHAEGEIALPMVGRVKVAGLTLDAAEKTILDVFVPKFYKDLSVHLALKSTETTTVLVLGNVRTPGLVALKRNERNLLYALALAGGFNGGLPVGPGISEGAAEGGVDHAGRPHANGAVRLRPLRPDRAETTYNLYDVDDVRRILAAPPLETGDVIIVDTTEESAIYMSGLVNRPGPLLLPAGGSLSLLRAIAAVGGLRDYIHVREGTLIRTLKSGEQVQVKLDLEKILCGAAPDIALCPGDVLDVPHTADTLFQEWFHQNILVGPFRIGVSYDPLQQYNADRALERQGVRNGILQSLGSGIPGIFVPPVPVPQSITTP